MSKKELIWNPDIYLQFASERIQPSIDLINRINLLHPKHILDVGCGPGNSTQILKSRWPHASIVGIDNSPDMIKNAKETYPQQKFILQDIQTMKSKKKHDIVFSNAVLQWIPNHEKVFAKLLDLTVNEGIIAVQVPQTNEMPITRIIESVYNTMFPDSTFNISNYLTFNTSNYYHNLLFNKVSKLDIWETTYIHTMESENMIIEMIKSTSLMPYLNNINESYMKDIFLINILEEIKKVYKKEESGKILYPFKRLFLIAQK